MREFWNKIPKTFQVCVIVSLILVFTVFGVVSWIFDSTFALQTAIISIFSFALLCVYVVWASRVSMHVKMQAEQNGDMKELASNAALKIQVGSLVKTLILAAFLVISIIVFKFTPVAALIGVSVMYIPLYTVPLFVKPALDNEDSEADLQKKTKVE